MSREEPSPIPANSRVRDFVAGEVFAGRYRLAEMLGQGGMGVVWRAHDETLDLDVALKFLHDVLAADDDALHDLKRETRRALLLTHPHIVRVHSLVEDAERSAAAIAMEYIPGESLTRRRLKQPYRYFEPSEIAPWLGQLCEALTYAHEKAGIIHRDLKPANILLDSRDEVRITDFGISATASDSITRLTGTTDTSGTLAYMSPQQAQGERPSPSDDLYALGSTLYELLTGKPPFYMGAILAQLATRTPPSIAQRREELHGRGTSVPDQWEHVVAMLLAKDAAIRPRSAREVALLMGLSGPSSAEVAKSTLGAGTIANERSAPVSRSRMELPPLGALPPIAGSAAPPPLHPALPISSGSSQGTPAATRLIWLGCGILIAAVTTAIVLAFRITTLEVPAETNRPPTRAPTSADASVASSDSRPRSSVPAQLPEPSVAPGPASTPPALVTPVPALAGHTAQQRTPGEWRVPEEQPTIRAAMAAAKAGEAVVIAPGTYSEFVELRTGIRLRGAGAEHCRIQPAEGARCVLLGAAVTDVIVEGVTIHSEAKDQPTVFNGGWRLDATTPVTPIVSRRKAESPRKRPEKSALVRIAAVDEDGPAAAAGLAPGDILGSLDGITVSTAEGANAILARRLTATPVPVDILRNNEPRQILLTPQLTPAEGWQDGIVLVNSSVTLKGCAVRGFGGDGIIIEGNATTPTVVENCTISDSGQRGLYITEASVTVIDSRLEANRGPGIVAENVLGDLLLERNTVIACQKGSGILLNNVVGTIRNCVSESNKLAGIAVMNAASNAVVEGNTCRENGTHGIWFSNRAKGTASGNVCEGNKGAGLSSIGEGTSVTAKKNSYARNKLSTFATQGGAIE